MGWLDANEYLLIASAARDRVDDLLASAELAIERAATTEQSMVTEPAHSCDMPGCTLHHVPV